VSRRIVLDHGSGSVFEIDRTDRRVYLGTFEFFGIEELDHHDAILVVRRKLRKEKKG
tara:strand:- start:153 stop:323 length:171 start_codon:yes stop_codon:yes gene_type:complete